MTSLSASAADLKQSEALNNEWTERFHSLEAEGLIDCKMKINVDGETTTASVQSAVTNLLRLRSAGKVRPLKLEA